MMTVDLSDMTRFYFELDLDMKLEADRKNGWIAVSWSPEDTRRYHLF